MAYRVTVRQYGVREGVGMGHIVLQVLHGFGPSMDRTAFEGAIVAALIHSTVPSWSIRTVMWYNSTV